MSGTLEWLASKLGAAPQPDPEVERAKHRNTLREVGVGLKKELKEAEESRAVEAEVYKKMLVASQGRAASEYGKRAVAAKRRVGECDRQIAAIKARLTPIEQTLVAAQQRQNDSKMAAAMAALTAAERNAPNAVTREQLASVMSDASDLVRDANAAERDLNSMDFSDPVDEAAFDADFAADYAAATAAPATAVAAGAASPLQPTEADLAAALEASIRNPTPQWSPEAAAAPQWTPPTTTTTNLYGM